MAISQIMATGRLGKIAGVAGVMTAILIAIGLGEGIALATDTDAGMLGVFSVFGYVGLTLWLILTGVSLWTMSDRQ